MMIVVRAVSVLCLMLSVFAVASQAQSVQTDFDKSFDFSKLKTFSFAIESRLPSDPLEQDPLNDGRIRDALESNLRASGFWPGDEGTPDFKVSYYVTTRDKLSVQDFGYDLPPWFGGRRDIRVNQFTEGTLIVDFIDAATGRLVWRGMASGSVELKGLGKKVNKAVEKLVKQFLKDIGRKP